MISRATSSDKLPYLFVSKKTIGKIVNSELGGEGKAAYRTVVEAFLLRAVYDSRSAEEFAQEDPILRVGFA
jgi:hypothetical protein